MTNPLICGRTPPPVATGTSGGAGRDTPARPVAAGNLPPETEAHFQRAVLRLAKLYGWWSYHTFDSRLSTHGWPDLALCRSPRLILAELKSERGRVSDAQRAWLDALGSCSGVEVYLWRPSDWVAIESVLRNMP